MEPKIPLPEEDLLYAPVTFTHIEGGGQIEPSGVNLVKGACIDHNNIIDL